jgi:hypothetical protein
MFVIGGSGIQHWEQLYRWPVKVKKGRRGREAACEVDG